jgi:hypothetical protein
MASYLFQLELSVSAEELGLVIPMQRAHINKLIDTETVLSYSVSLGNNMIWCVLDAADEQEAIDVVLQFPLYPHFSEISCYPLSFHNTTLQTSLPRLSPN